MKHHGLWMIIGCILPLLIIFLLPLFGISGGISMFVIILVIFAAHAGHLLLMARHTNRRNGKGGDKGGHHGH